MGFLANLLPRHYLSEALPWRIFLDDNVICLRHKGILQGFNLTGPSPDMADKAELAQRVEQYGRSLGQLGSGDEIQIVFDRLPAPEMVRQTFQHPAAQLVHDEMREAAAGHWITPARLYLSHQYAPPVVHLARRLLIGEPPRPREKKDHHLLREQALTRFTAFRDACRGAIDLTPMNRGEMFRDLLYRVSYSTDPISLPGEGVDLARVIGSSARQLNGYYPSIDGWHIRPIVITAYPTDTLPQMLSSLLEHPGYLTVSCRYSAMSQVEAQGMMKAYQHHWLQESMGGIVGFIQHLLKSKVINRHALEQVELIEGAIKSSQNGWSFGRTSVVVMVRDRDLEQADSRAHDLLSTLHGQGIMARIEDTGAALAVENSWPGHLILEKRAYSACRHKIPLTGWNFADLSLPATYWQGSDVSLFTCSGAASIPFSVPARVNGLGHMLCIGPSGSGKSTFLSVLACSALAQPDSKVAWLDLDYSSYVLAHLLGADYHDLGNKTAKPLCPLAVLDQPGGLEWLALWFERLFQRRKLELEERATEMLMTAMRQAQTDGTRDLMGLRAKLYGEDHDQSRIRRILRELATTYEHVLGGAQQEISHNRVTVYEMRGLHSLPRYISAPATELILHQITAQLDGSPAWVLADEFWSLLGDEISAEWLFDTIRTLRKKNAAFIGCTQSLVEIVNSPYRDLLLENCGARLYLPNHEASNSYVSQNYLKVGVSPHEVACIAGSSLGAFFYKSAAGSRAASCLLGDLGKAICGATGYKDVERARGLVADGHLDLDSWLWEQGVHLSADRQASDRRGARAVSGEHDGDGGYRSNGLVPLRLAVSG